jgi:hypothetical protein
MMDMFNAPQHLVAFETAKHVYNVGGPDMRDVMPQLPCCQNIPDDQQFLEPTELGKKFGISAIKMNKQLMAFGLQMKNDMNEWIPTDDGKDCCVKHAWQKGGKSGYNLKWNLVEVKKRIEA